MRLFSLLAVLLLSVPSRGAVREVLAGEGPLRVAFLGDSLTAGYELEQPARDSFAALLTTMLQLRYGARRIETRVVGLPGYDTGGGLAVWETSIQPFAPHLVILQFGGNDKGTGPGLGNLERYRTNLTRLIGRSRRLAADAVVVAPPMHEPVRDMPYPAAAREVAAMVHAPLADFDAALKVGGLDYRGLFPYGLHPHEDAHARMARELWRTLAPVLGEPGKLQILPPESASEASLGGEAVVRPRLLSPGPARPVTLQAVGTEATCETAVADAATATLRLPLPQMLPHGRTSDSLLWLLARAGDEWALLPGRLRLAPVLAAAAPLNPTAPPLAQLAAPNLAVGRGLWEGPADLSARAWVGCTAEAMRIRVDVTDDSLSAGQLPDGDGVELFLDLRPDTERGQPWGSPLTPTLFLDAAVPEGETGRVRSLDRDQPPGELLELLPVRSPLPDGYRIELAIPRELLDRLAGRHVDRIGFDLAVDDTDEARGRESQMVWLGRWDNFVNPAWLGELTLDTPVPPGRVRVRLQN